VADDSGVEKNDWRTRRDDDDDDEDWNNNYKELILGIKFNIKCIK
jgi:hypothetical protein